MKKLALLFTTLALLAAACGTSEPVATPSPVILPVALPTDTPTLTVTPPQPTQTATPILIDGTLTIKVNVRSGPGTNFRLARSYWKPEKKSRSPPATAREPGI